jgi:small neutral amino acid transporter SnatA (MarC family)
MASSGSCGTCSRPYGEKVSRTDAIILRTAAAWTIFIWVTRIRNILGDETRSTGFKAVHTVLALVSVAFAIAILGVASRNRRRAREKSATPS